MKCVLDTHFLLWITMGAARIDEFPWLERYRPWGISPVSFLEVQYLAEVGKLEVRIDEFIEAVLDDARFTVDDVPLLTLMRQAVGVEWTLDPFDRLLSAHSQARRLPLCSVDRQVRQHHSFLPAELKR